jgi:hypothetical protein
VSPISSSRFDDAALPAVPAAVVAVDEEEDPVLLVLRVASSIEHSSSEGEGDAEAIERREAQSEQDEREQDGRSLRGMGRDRQRGRAGPPLGDQSEDDDSEREDPVQRDLGDVRAGALLSADEMPQFRGFGIEDREPGAVGHRDGAQPREDVERREVQTRFEHVRDEEGFRRQEEGRRREEERTEREPRFVVRGEGDAEQDDQEGRGRRQGGVLVEEEHGEDQGQEGRRGSERDMELRAGGRALSATPRLNERTSRGELTGTGTSRRAKLEHRISHEKTNATAWTSRPCLVGTRCGR